MSRIPDKARDILSRNFLFSQLSPKELDDLLRFASTRRLPARQEVFHKGDSGTQLFAILDGRVKVETSSITGKALVFRVLEPGQTFGEMALLDGGARSATISTLEPCELLVIERRDFRDFLRHSPAVYDKLLVALTARVRDLSELLEDATFLPVAARLAKRLLVLARTFGRESEDGTVIDLRLSQGELSNLVGATREAVNKQLRAWEDAGLVALEEGHVVLRDEDGLADVAEGGDE